MSNCERPLEWHAARRMGSSIHVLRNVGLWRLSENEKGTTVVACQITPS